ncbi:hypothetical protein ElyMa_002628400 [Elysia marginata]|uniref:Uncharacterized protein n=1 Tax=Elysia marginata TaxID=1093978 RepID=A0AAV4H3T8_9GAST|nr:hypothetical protein ElyMa_002628400 [Elysia marginata]
MMMMVDYDDDYDDGDDYGNEDIDNNDNDIVHDDDEAPMIMVVVKLGMFFSQIGLNMNVQRSKHSDEPKTILSASR